jgi:hypothetical protein
MTTTNSYNRQPTAFDYASPTQFKFGIIKLPKVEYFCTAVNIPAVGVSQKIQQTPLNDIPLPGEKVDFSPLEMTFLVDENLENYKEIHGWLMGIGFPKDYAQAREALAAGADRFPTSTGANLTTDPGKVKYGATNIGALYSDATLVVLSSKNRPVQEVRFINMFPTSLSGLQYSQTATDVDYLTATVSFNYNRYEFADVGASTTSIVSS